MFEHSPEAELSPANAIRELDSGERYGRRPKGIEAQHWGAAPLDREVLLLDDVVQISATANDDRSPSRIFSSK